MRWRTIRLLGACRR